MFFKAQNGFFLWACIKPVSWLASCKMGNAAYVAYFPASHSWLVLCMIPYNKDKLANPAPP